MIPMVINFDQYFQYFCWSRCPFLYVFVGWCPNDPQIAGYKTHSLTGQCWILGSWQLAASGKFYRRLWKMVRLDTDFSHGDFP